MPKKLPLKLCATLATILTLSACSTVPTGSETNAAIFAALGKTLPTASRNDTEQTQREIGIHRKVFFDLCEELSAECQK